MLSVRTPTWPKQQNNTNFPLPARMAFPGCVSLAFPAGAAAARHCGLSNGLTNPGCGDMTGRNFVVVVVFPLLFFFLKSTRTGWLDEAAAAVSQSVSE